ncbi:MAG TPA: Uma2 family endonuclease [Tepidisphaeraceae bacterium]|nr:Uma2 family endonuclease [Tepidisphaeraceae bacterium]
MTTFPPIAPVARITPEELLAMPDSVDYELVDGKLVERNMGLKSSAIAMRIGQRLLNFLDTQKAGHVFGSEAAFRCFPDDADKVRKPDVSFIRNGRLPGERDPDGYGYIAPDLVVEVISPNDKADEVDEKIQEYLTAGVPLIWIVHPKTRIVQIHRPPTSPLGASTRLTESDTITGEDVLTGFSCPVAAFFGLK